ncbi:two-component system response regulator [filamentous cyanobacterium LEGE 11480]|uniref:Two-component system response regulator n=1 Tax=Romeriopsis navalis LEGE 11480 TaxID=2777977 RepID=A0A928VNF8_9CYAN|nr:two-component system response regulator [Romeriopsis navalis]MBE9029094.1 two-component system response regulator [Romeriopsis navalis LEGE 11480]
MSTLEQEQAKVLIVDDTGSSRAMAVDVLICEGYEVLEADNGYSAIDIVHQHQPDLVLLDVLMPGIDGYEVCRRLKQDENTRLMPVIFMTSLEEKSARIQGIEAGGDDFLTKPFDRVELSARVKSLVRQKRLNQDLDHAEKVLFSIAKTVESRDPNTGDHCERLVQRGKSFGEYLGLSRSEVQDLMWGGYLHDIGKVGIADAILLKPGRFTPAEFELMKQHTLIGENICKPLRTMQGVVPIIRHHHERWDGSGYPDQLQGDEIPYLAQIFQLIDIYDALVSERPYKDGMTPEHALEMMQKEVDKGWRNPALFKQFKAYIYAVELKQQPASTVWFDRYLKPPSQVSQSQSSSHSQGVG